MKLLTVFGVGGSHDTSYLLAAGRGPQSLRQDSNRWQSPQRMLGLAQQKNTGSRRKGGRKEEICTFPPFSHSILTSR